MADDIRVIEQNDPHYPKILQHIADPPKRLYVRGNSDILSHEPMLAVVGSRKANTYGKQCITSLLPPVVQAGVPIVSGLAYGIDSLAHGVCVQANAPTIAVLGSGIDDASIYPRAHVNAAKEILDKGGAIVSEYEPKSRVYQGNFPKRNRIIAGLCQATLVIQASKKSGSLITARLALEYNRDVLAVPGPIGDHLSAGTNSLIQNGAHVALSASDILELLNIDPDKNKQEIQPALLSPAQQTIINTLTATPKHIDEIVAASKLPASQVSSLLIELELTEQVEHLGGMKYIKK